MKRELASPCVRGMVLLLISCATLRATADDGTGTTNAAALIHGYNYFPSFLDGRQERLDVCRVDGHPVRLPFFGGMAKAQTLTVTPGVHELQVRCYKRGSAWREDSKSEMLYGTMSLLLEAGNEYRLKPGQDAAQSGSWLIENVQTGKRWDFEGTMRTSVFTEQEVRACDRGSGGISPLQLSMMNPWQLPPENWDIVGVRINLIKGQSRSVFGIDAGLVNQTSRQGAGVAVGLANLTSDIYSLPTAGYDMSAGDRFFPEADGSFADEFYARYWGLQVGGLNCADTMRGAQVGLGNGSGRVNGVQCSVFANLGIDVTGVQATAGLFGGNIADTVCGVQATMLGINIVEEDLCGMQLGMHNRAKTVYGVQVGLLWNSAQEVHGLQLGLGNKTESLRGVQIGLLNMVAGRALPLLNASF